MLVCACKIGCVCGGLVDRLVDDEYYVLEEGGFIVFRGLCNRCQEIVGVRKSIYELLLLCPIPDQKGN